MVLPLSSYPKHLNANDPVKILAIDLDKFTSDDYRMYLVGCTPTQFGPGYMQRVHSHIAFATSVVHWQWLDRNGAVPLSKEDNTILTVNDTGSLCVCVLLFCCCVSIHFMKFRRLGCAPAKYVGINGTLC